MGAILYEEFSKVVYAATLQDSNDNYCPEMITDIDELAKYSKNKIESEEKGEIIGESEYTWFIDPIDGTINFAAGIPLFSTSIALKKNNEAIFGLVIDYNQNDVYYAFKGQGAYYNDNTE